MSNLAELEKRVQNRTSFLAYLHALQHDCEAHPEHWEHQDVERFLAALATWLEDMGDVMTDARASTLAWRDVARMLTAARGYE
jgi:hypothetical protein